MVTRAFATNDCDSFFSNVGLIRDYNFMRTIFYLEELNF
jgi:hypothetical protein